MSRCSASARDEPNLARSIPGAGPIRFASVVAGAGWPTAMQSCLLLCAANLIYYLRAKTEERHLSADPSYRDYKAYIAEHGLLARLRHIGAIRRQAL